MNLLMNKAGGVCACISAYYYTKQAMDIVTERCQPHPGVLEIYELWKVPTLR